MPRLKASKFPEWRGRVTLIWWAPRFLPADRLLGGMDRVGPLTASLLGETEEARTLLLLEETQHPVAWTTWFDLHVPCWTRQRPEEWRGPARSLPGLCGGHREVGHQQRVGRRGQNDIVLRTSNGRRSEQPKATTLEPIKVIFLSMLLHFSLYDKNVVFSAFLAV